MKISITNSKLGNQIPSVNLPAIITCRENAPCSKLCYARKGNFQFPNVKKSHLENLEHYQRNPIEFFDEIIDFLNNGLTSYRFLRFHSSGDIPDMEYLEGMVKVAKACPQTKFLCFTKKFELVNKYCDRQLIEYKNPEEIILPKNLRIVFSMWNDEYNQTVKNPYNFPTTWVRFCDGSMDNKIPEMAIPCIGTCYKCLSCWSLQPGQSTVFHQH